MSKRDLLSIKFPEAGDELWLTKEVNGPDEDMSLDDLLDRAEHWELELWEFYIVRITEDGPPETDTVPKVMRALRPLLTLGDRVEINFQMKFIAGMLGLLKCKLLSSNHGLWDLYAGENHVQIGIVSSDDDKAGMRNYILDTVADPDSYPRSESVACSNEYHQFLGFEDRKRWLDLTASYALQRKAVAWMRLHGLCPFCMQHERTARRVAEDGFKDTLGELYKSPSITTGLKLAFSPDYPMTVGEAVVVTPEGLVRPINLGEVPMGHLVKGPHGEYAVQTVAAGHYATPDGTLTRVEPFDFSTAMKEYGF